MINSTFCLLKNTCDLQQQIKNRYKSIIIVIYLKKAKNIYKW